MAFKAVGTPQIASSGGQITVPWPAGHAAGDVALLHVYCRSNQTLTLDTAAGFALVRQEVNANVEGARLAIWWARADSGAMASPQITPSGNIIVGQITTYDNVLAAGDPINVTNSAVEDTVITAVSIPGATTTVDGCTVVTSIGARIDAAADTQISAWTNANLSDFAERVEVFDNSQNGGGYGTASGEQASAGDYGATTATLAISAPHVTISLALKPPAGGGGTSKRLIGGNLVGSGILSGRLIA